VFLAVAALTVVVPDERDLAEVGLRPAMAYVEQVIAKPEVHGLISYRGAR
jgi:hypothetical protein